MPQWKTKWKMDIKPNSHKERVLHFLYETKWASISQLKDACNITSSSLYGSVLTPLLKNGFIKKCEAPFFTRGIYGISEKGRRLITGKETKIKPHPDEKVYEILLRNEVYINQRKKNPKLRLLTDDEVYEMGLTPTKDEYVFYDGEEYYLSIIFVIVDKLPKSLNPILDRKAQGRLSYREIITHLWFLIREEKWLDEAGRLLDEQPDLDCELHLLQPE